MRNACKREISKGLKEKTKWFAVSVIIMTVLVFLAVAAFKLSSGVIGGTVLETTAADVTQAQETMPGVMASEPFEEVTYLTKSVLEAMDSRRLAAFYADMCYLSETKELSLDEIEMIAVNFYNIFQRCPAFEREEYDRQSYQVFCNIYDQAISRQLNLDEMYAWVSIPVPEILCLYFSSDHFATPEMLACEAFNWMEAQEIARVTDAFFSNPVMTGNVYMPAFLIVADCDAETTKRAWQHFQDLSESVSPNTTLSSVAFTEEFCNALMLTALDQENVHKIVNVAEAMMQNPYYDIKTKYMRFCNAFYNGEKKEYSDGTLAFRASDMLLVLAKDADAVTRAQLEELVDLLWDDSIAQALSDALASG